MFSIAGAIAQKLAANRTVGAQKQAAMLSSARNASPIGEAIKYRGKWIPVFPGSTNIPKVSPK